MEDGADLDAGRAYEETDAEELLEQAQANAQALIIATVAFLDERGIPLDAWTASLGATFAKAWDEPGDWDAGEFLDAMLTNFRSLGAEVVSAELGPDRAEAVANGFPDPDLCALFGVEVALAARFIAAAAAIAGERGLSWAWHLDGERTRYVVAKAEG